MMILFPLTKKMIVFLSPGDHVRARRIAKFLDPTPKVFELTSQRGFTTFTGCYLGVPVSIIAIGMVNYFLDITWKLDPPIPVHLNIPSFSCGEGLEN
jgi:hypothetical protein